MFIQCRGHALALFARATRLDMISVHHIRVILGSITARRVSAFRYFWGVTLLHNEKGWLYFTKLRPSPMPFTRFFIMLPSSSR
jgi:hypothetical protein